MCNVKLRNEKIGFCLIISSKKYFDPCVLVHIVALDQTRHLRPFSGSVRKNYSCEDLDCLDGQPPGSVLLLEVSTH